MSVEVDRIPADYVQIVLYVLFVAVGLPVNVSTFVYMLRRYRHARNPLLLLHINLNLSDILVLSVYCTGFIAWFVTYEWEFGETACITMRFMDHLVFQISSIVMVCIALYRLYALRYPMVVSTVGQSRVFGLMGAAWLLAVVLSLPQVFIWKQIEFGGMTQCVTIWTEQILRNETGVEVNMTHMKLYNIYHLMTIFYVPLAILTISYVLIMSDVCRTLRQHEEPYSLTEMTKVSAQRYSVRLLAPFPLRGQDRLRRAKVKSLRITLLLIIAYVVTWLPYNLLSWWMVVNVEGYRKIEDLLYCLNCLVVLNSVINPFIYGRCRARVLRVGKKEARTKKRAGPAGCCLFAAS
uniref:G_PROTEIN_RECEP_F1_2 domain-containing protein n=1 Tax=Steinernema glaseri TaxID=37863 RepID=A0A1I7Z1I9_9BILA